MTGPESVPGGSCRKKNRRTGKFQKKIGAILTLGVSLTIILTRDRDGEAGSLRAGDEVDRKENPRSRSGTASESLACDH